MKVILDPYSLELARSINADFNGNSFESIAYYGLGIQLIVTVVTDVTGVFKVQHSNDDLNWFDSNIFKSITLTAVPAGTTSYGFTGGTNQPNESVMIPWKHSRIVWHNTSGTGTVTALVTGVRV